MVGDGAQISPDTIMGTDVTIGKNVRINSGCIIGNHVSIGSGTIIKERCIILDYVSIGNDCRIDYGVLFREHVTVGNNTFIGRKSILGELLADQMKEIKQKHSLIIGSNAVIRSDSVIYGGSSIGDNFQTGHHVTVREWSQIGNHVSIGTASDLQDRCILGNYVRLHSNVFLGQLSRIDDYAWLFPHVVMTNDPTPPSEELLGGHICSFAVIAAKAVILPGICVGKDSLVGAGSVVTKDVDEYTVVVGNPARAVSDVRKLKNKVTGENAYPWREHFRRGMPWEREGFQVWMNAEGKERR